MIRYACGFGLIACFVLIPQGAPAQEIAPPVENRPSVHSILEDLKSVVSKESASLLGVATAMALVASPFDDTLTHSASCSTFLKTTFGGWARVVGQEWLLGGGAVAAYAIGRLTNRPQLALVGGDLLEAEVVAGAATLTLKQTFRRTRPDGEPYSFPSGHASGTFAAATVIQRHFGWKGAVPAYAMATLITGARLQANAHYATDLIAGATLGILAGRAATFDLGPRRILLSPAVVTGGVAITGTIH